MKFEHLDHEKWMKAMEARARGVKPYAMFSTWFNGIVTEPELMMLPIDDHIVHRGDGVFEAMRLIDNKLYDMEAHLERMVESAKGIELEIPWSSEVIADAIIHTCRAAKESAGVVRVYVSRGPGGFTANPYESIGSQLYILLTPFKPMSPEKYLNGMTAGIAKTKMKPKPWSRIKSCNYLQNVLMKKEAKDSGLDFTLSVTEDGFVGEGATESFALVIENELVAPVFDYTLRGTTLLRAMDLASNNLQVLGLSAVKQRDVSIGELKKCQEAFFIGTTVEVSPIVRIDGGSVADGQVGPVAKKLRELLQEDMRAGRFLTEI